MCFKGPNLGHSPVMIVKIGNQPHCTRDIVVSTCRLWVLRHRFRPLGPPCPWQPSSTPSLLIPFTSSTWSVCLCVCVCVPSLCGIVCLWISRVYQGMILTRVAWALGSCWLLLSKKGSGRSLWEVSYLLLSYLDMMQHFQQIIVQLCGGGRLG